MSAKSGGSLATFLMSVPLAAIPLMAIFGIPQFAPVAASPDRESEISLGEAYPERDLRDRYRQRSSDLLSELDDRDRMGHLSDAPAYDPFRERTVETRDLPDSAGLRRETGAGSEDYVVRAADSSLAVPPRTAGDEARRPQTLDWDNGADHIADRAISVADPVSTSAGTPGESSRFLETHGSDPTSATTLTWREAARELKERGIENFRLERGHDADTFLFVCTFAPGDNPHVTMRFEAEAIEPLAAVGNVLDQVDHWLRTRFSAPQGVPSRSDATP